MAEIPVEKKEKSGFPWWLIPLLLLLLLLPLLYFCTRDTANTNTNGNTNANRAGATSNASNMNGGAMNNSGGGASGAGNTAVVVNSTNGAGAMNNSGTMNNGGAMNNSGAAVTDVNMFGTTTDKATLVGRNSTLSSVRVGRVVSDKIFTVKSGAGEMFVMLDDNLDSGGKEKQISMKSGQNVNISGAFRNVPTGEVKEEAKGGGLNQKEYAQMKGQNVYLHATSVSDVK